MTPCCLAEAQSTLAESEQARAAFKAETQRLLNDRHAAATSKLQQLTQEGAKASQRERQTQLTAPVAGVIQQLAIHLLLAVLRRYLSNKCQLDPFAGPRCKRDEHVQTEFVPLAAHQIADP